MLKFLHFGSQIKGQFDDDRMRRFIRQCSEVVDVCVELASRIKPPKKGLTQGEADLAAIRQMCKV